MDLHCHLNGSLSLKFLEKCARRNGCFSLFQNFLELKREYFRLTRTQPTEGYLQEQIRQIWEQFGLVHQMILNQIDVEEATFDLVLNSKAFYLEIRTTPKCLKGIPGKTNPSTREQYIDSFLKGLRKSNHFHKGKKIARGLLSLDRTLHTEEDALFFVDLVRKNRDVLVGIDVCGNPEGERKLFGDSLSRVVELCFSSGVGLCIHVGESPCQRERDDLDVVLCCLERIWDQYRSSILSSSPSSSPSLSPSSFFQGKVRFGHGIHIEKRLQQKIQKLQIAIEICPTCHSRVNWHLPNQPHPVSSIYSSLSDPLVFGTDDCLIFDADLREEREKFCRIFANSEGWSWDQIVRHHAKFAFTKFSEPEFKIASKL